MLSKQEYNLIKEQLEKYDLDVHHEEDFTDFINYREKEFKRIVYAISKDENRFYVNTHFGLIALETIGDVLDVIKTDWDKDNWIEEEIDGETWVSLKVPFTN